MYSRAKQSGALFAPIRSLPQLGFDEESGQVYMEVAVPVRKTQHSDWIGELRTPLLFQKTPMPRDYGARSLFAMARNKTARVFRQMNAHHFDGVPWEVAKPVYEEILYCRGESLHTWRVFAESYYNIEELGGPSYRYKIDINTPSLPFRQYFRGLTSSPCYWLTCLRISPKQLQPNDLIDISNITNLSILDLSDEQSQVLTHLIPSPFNERILRTWACQAHASTHFQHLRALLLGWQDNVLSDWLFKYLDAFPQLQCVIITDCPNIHQRNRCEWEELAKDHGWTFRRAKHSAKSLRPILDDGSFYLGGVSGLYYTSESSLDTDKYAREELKPKSLGSRPILESWIGNPKAWTHIIDDFPGTRTVWFDKFSRPKPEFRAAMVKELNVLAEQMNVLPDQPKRIRDTAHVDRAMASPPRKKNGNHALAYTPAAIPSTSGVSQVNTENPRKVKDKHGSVNQRNQNFKGNTRMGSMADMLGDFGIKNVTSTQRTPGPSSSQDCLEVIHSNVGPWKKASGRGTIGNEVSR